MTCEVCEDQSPPSAPRFPVRKAVPVSGWIDADLPLPAGSAALFPHGFVCFLATLPGGVMIQGWIFLLRSLKAQ